MSPPLEGVKYDNDKIRYDLSNPLAEQEINAARTWGAEKYDDDNWKKVPDLQRRYYSALMRHVEAFRIGDRWDPETGLHHLAHAACCIGFMLAADLEDVAAGGLRASASVVLASAIRGLREKRAQIPGMNTLAAGIAAARKTIAETIAESDLKRSPGG